MDVPSELICEQVNEEAKLENSLRAFDPLVGDLSAPFHVFDGSKRLCGFIAFPMGDSGCDLSEDVSHLLVRRRFNATVDFSNLEFSVGEWIITEPSQYPAIKLETPICQTVSSPPPSDSSKGTFPYFERGGLSRRVETVMGVRTFSSTALLSLFLPTSDSEQSKRTHC